VAELTLAGGAYEHAENGGAADGRDFGSRRELRSEDERHQRAEHRKIDDVEEISCRDEPDYSSMQRRNFGVVERCADKALDGLSHGMPSPARRRCGRSQCFFVVIAVAPPQASTRPTEPDRKSVV